MDKEFEQLKENIDQF